MRELQRRRVFRMTAWYILAGWVAIQVASEALPALKLDDSTIRYVWIAVLAGFPLAVFFSWKYEVTAGGIRRTVATRSAKPGDLRLAATDYVLLSCLALLAVFGLYNLSGRALQEGATAQEILEASHLLPGTIAVLPLENLSPDAEQEYFVSGMHEALINSLCKVSALRVTSRTSAKLVDTDLTVPMIARTLGVANVIEGSILREGDRVRVSVQLIDAASDRHLWAETYERAVDDVLGLQADVARSVALAVQVKLTSQDEQQLARSLDIRPDTWESYLKAMFQFRKETLRGREAGIAILEEALENDPTSALAYAGLAQGWSELGHSFFPVRGAYPRAKAAADRAIAIDDTLAEAHLAVGMYKAYYEYDWAGAEASLRRAIELNPSLVDAWYHLAWLLELFERDEEAIEYGEKAVELDPLSPIWSAWLADQYRDAGDYDRALELAQSVVALNPQYPVARYALGNVYLELGRYEEAIEAHSILEQRPFWAFALAQTYAWAGQPEKALEIAKGYEPLPQNGIPLTIIYAALGDVEQTIYWSRQAWENRLPWSVAFFSYFTAPRSLYEDPRIQAEATRYPTPLVPYPKP